MTRSSTGPDAVWSVTRSPTSVPVARAMFFAITATRALAGSSAGVYQRPASTAVSNSGRSAERPTAMASLPSSLTSLIEHRLRCRPRRVSFGSGGPRPRRAACRPTVLRSDVVVDGRSRPLSVVVRDAVDEAEHARAGCRPRSAICERRSRGCAACGGRRCAGRSAPCAAGSATPPQERGRRRLAPPASAGLPRAPRARQPRAAADRRQRRQRRARRSPSTSSRRAPARRRRSRRDGEERRPEVAGTIAFAMHDAERDPEHRADRAEQQRGAQVDAADLAAAAADRLHDPDLATSARRPASSSCSRSARAPRAAPAP